MSSQDQNEANKMRSWSGFNMKQVKAENENQLLLYCVYTLYKSDVASKVCRRITLPGLFSCSLIFMLPIFWGNCNHGQLYDSLKRQEVEEHLWASSCTLCCLSGRCVTLDVQGHRKGKCSEPGARGPQNKPKEGSDHFTSPAALSFLDVIFFLVLVHYLRII